MEILHCMEWSDGIFTNNDCDYAETQADAIFLLHKYRSDIVWNVLKNFEGTPVTLPQTEVILAGQSVAGLAIKDLLKVKHYGDAVHGLIAMLEDDSFHFDMPSLCSLHGALAKDEVLRRGAFRERDVKLKHIKRYSPPPAYLLRECWTNGSKVIDSITNPLEKAAVAFLFLARTQFFEDGNKRTAFLAMNGLLVKNSINPFLFPQDDSERFMECLADFYESGHADDMLRLIRAYATEDMSESEDLSPQI